MRRYDELVRTGARGSAFAGLYDWRAVAFAQTTATHEPSYVPMEVAAEAAVARAAGPNITKQAAADRLKTPVLSFPPAALGTTASGTDILVTLGFGRRQPGPQDREAGQ
jgi:hypothetical protein